MLLLVKLQAESSKFTTSNTPPWMFFTFFKLHKWYQIGQSVSNYLQEGVVGGGPVGAVVTQLLAAEKNWIVAIIEIFGFETLVLAKVME